MDGFDVENVPLVSLLNDVLSEYTGQLRALLGQFDTDGNRNTSADTTHTRQAAAIRLAALDRQLQQLHGALGQHQTRQQAIRRHQQLAMRTGAAKLRFVDSLLDAQTQLDAAVADAGKRIERARVAEGSRPRVDEVVAYAGKLSRYTAAPPNYDPGAAMPAEPPYPMLVPMRAGILNRYRAKKTSRDGDEADEDQGEFMHHADNDQFGDVDADDLLLGLDLNPDLE
ncbi:hypothetical protein H4S01_001047 [Coemansia sp. RSA 2610]|nr:hypothetical protein H4S01_001047 [Coemansia sp. RSA 2610]